MRSPAHWPAPAPSQPAPADPTAAPTVEPSATAQPSEGTIVAPSASSSGAPAPNNQAGGTTQQPPSRQNSLAQTGANLLPYTLGGLALLAVGAGAMALIRRTKS